MDQFRIAARPLASTSRGSPRVQESKPEHAKYASLVSPDHARTIHYMLPRWQRFIYLTILRVMVCRLVGQSATRLCFSLCGVAALSAVAVAMAQCRCSRSPCGLAADKSSIISLCGFTNCIASALISNTERHFHCHVQAIRNGRNPKMGGVAIWRYSFPAVVVKRFPECLQVVK